MSALPALVYATAPYGYFRDALLSPDRVPGHVERRDFPDGERLLRISEEVVGRDTILVGGTLNDRSTLELYDLACGLVTYGARRLTLVIPYFGCSTMERATRRGEVVTAKTRARLLSSIPPANYGNRALLLDLHTEGIPHYFEGDITAFHLYAKRVVARIVRRHVGDDDFVIACTDAGRAKWVESLANQLGVQAAFVFKRRISGTEVEVMAESAEVRGRTVVLYDDMIRTGGSLIRAAEAYKVSGATRMFAVATHGVLPGNAVEKLRASGLFERIVVTDTLPRARTMADDFVQVESVAEIFADELNGPV